MSVTVSQNFDWAETERKLVVFMPNHKVKEFVEFSISMIQTVLPDNDWLIVIGNDNCDDDFSHLYSKNVRFFTLHTKDEYRNGCFIRNYAIKRCRSNLFFQKDGEVVILGDFMNQFAGLRYPAWRCGFIFVLNDRKTKELMSGDIPDPNKWGLTCTRKAQLFIPEYPEEARDIIADADGKANYSTYFHYGFGVETEVLQSMHGYDEDICKYGWEDSDMICRLIAMGIHLVPDYTCAAVHPNHPRHISNAAMADEMRPIFISRNPRQFIRNPIKWGEGE